MRGIVKIRKLRIGTVTDGYGFLVPIELYLRAIEGEKGNYELVGNFESANYVRVEEIDGLFHRDFPRSIGLEPIPVKYDFDFGGFYGASMGGTYYYSYDDERIVKVDRVPARVDYPLCPVPSEMGYVMVTEGHVSPVRCTNEKHLMRNLLRRRFEYFYEKRYNMKIRRDDSDSIVVVVDGGDNVVLTSRLPTNFRGARGYVATTDGVYYCNGTITDCFSRKNRLFDWEIKSQSVWISIDNVMGNVLFSIGSWRSVRDEFTNSVSVVNEKSGEEFVLSSVSIEEFLEMIRDLMVFGMIII